MPRLQYNKGIPYPKNEESWKKKGGDGRTDKCILKMKK